MPKVILSKLVGKEELKKDIFKFSCHIGDLARNVKPGQFVEVKVSENIDPFLRRPISVYNIDKENGVLEFIFRIQGKRNRHIS